MPSLLPLVVAMLAAFVPARCAGAAELRWRQTLLAPDTRTSSALAFEPATGRLAVGDARGVLVGEDPSRLRRVARRGPVRDLAFLLDGHLLVASEAGLFELDAEGRLLDRTPGAGARSRQTTRVAVHGEAILVATAAGPFFARRGEPWQRLDAGIPTGLVSAVAVRPSAAGLEVWVVVEGEVWRALLVERPNEPLRVARVVQEKPFDGQVGRSALDLVLAERGPDDVLVVDDRRLAVRDASARWRVERPLLPPGAVVQRLVHAGDALWLATDRGLLRANGPAGPWERAGGPAASASVRDLVSAGERLYAATDSGLLVGEWEGDHAAAAAGAPGPARPRPPEGPSVELVQRVALTYLGLHPGEIRRLRRGVARRGWLPVLDLRLDRDSHRRRTRDHDEAFTSGALRHLHDADRSWDTDYGAALVLSWDFGDLAYNAEAVDVSREAREVIELRDDVLDEVNQLYFERLRVLLSLETSTDPIEARRLRVRADELAAGLDAWTGGWFGQALVAATPPHPASTGANP